MGAISDFLEHFPLVTFIVVVTVIVAAVKAVGGDISFDQFVSFTEKLLIGGGALGGARALLAHGSDRADYSAYLSARRRRR